jgi:hypothetical protein
MAFPSPRSLPQQPHGGGGTPPDLSSVVDKFMKKSPPKPPLGAEAMIRQDKEMRSWTGGGDQMWPTPRKEGPVPRPEHERDLEMSGDLDPLFFLNQSRFRQGLKFPEVFGGASPDFLQGNPIDDQKMLWEAQMSDRPRDIQGPGQMLVPNQTPWPIRR